MPGAYWRPTALQRDVLEALAAGARMTFERGRGWLIERGGERRWPNSHSVHGLLFRDMLARGLDGGYALTGAGLHALLGGTPETRGATHDEAARARRQGPSGRGRAAQ